MCNISIKTKELISKNKSAFLDININAFFACNLLFWKLIENLYSQRIIWTYNLNNFTVLGLDDPCTVLGCCCRTYKYYQCCCGDDDENSCCIPLEWISTQLKTLFNVPYKLHTQQCCIYQQMWSFNNDSQYYINSCYLLLGTAF